MDFFFIPGMTNMSYILFFIFDLPINYNEFHEIAASVMRQLFTTHLKFMNFGKRQGLNLNIFYRDDRINKPKWIFFVKNI